MAHDDPLRRLPWKTREVYRLWAEEGLQLHQLSEMFKVSKERIRQELAKAIRILRAARDQDDKDSD
jgi:DNA-directed RNA polymerase sigma subunit (sigma70/sigma32)